MVAVTYTVEMEDMRALQRYFRKTSPQVLRMRLFIGVILLGLSALYTSRRFHEGPGEMAVYFLGMFVLMALVSSVFVFVLNRFGETAGMRGIERNGVLGEHTITLTPEALHEQTAVNDTKATWRGIHRIDATRDYLFIFTQPHMAYLIPRRAFATPADAEAFVAKAREYFDTAQSAS